MSGGYYEEAQVCPNGHVANSSVLGHPDRTKEFCEICGEATLMTCPNCDTPIRSDYIYPNIVSMSLYEPPAYCYRCGKAFPWTERRLIAAYELFCDDIKDDEDRRVFQESVQAISKDTPQAQVASNRIVKLLSKAGKATSKAIRDILVDVASEAVKKVIMPDS